MRKWIVIMVLMPLVTGLWAQEETPEQEVGDTTIYKVVEEMPRFPGCEQLDTTIAVKAQCAQQSLLNYVYSNIVYPLEARQNGNEGQVVVNFVVEKDGSVSSPNIVKDIGGGCGLEVLRVINLMNQQGLRWTPGKMNDEVVRTRFNLPVRFKLEEAPPYTMIGADTVYTSFDEPPSFQGGDEALIAHIDEQLDYPESAADTCMIGIIDVQLLIQPDGVVRILNMTDYSNLGFDFWYEATEAATSTIGKWNVGTYEGREVPASYEISMYFEPENPACRTTIDNYQKATELANEGATLFNEGDQEQGIEKMSQAVELFPNNATFLYMRGQAYLDMNRLDEACSDLTRARDIALTDWFKDVLPIICR